MKWDKIGLLFSLSRFKTHVNITTSTDCYLVTGSIVTQITFMFNQSLCMGIFPPAWAVATITPIPKSGNKCFVNNWRPISILPVVGKLLEKL